VKFASQEDIEALTGNLGWHSKYRHDRAFRDAQRAFKTGVHGT
jgi:hypothetical protein